MPSRRRRQKRRLSITKWAGSALSFPRPAPGLVIRYSFLWWSEFERGQEEGLKDRPCAIVLAAADEGADQLVTVLPITHSPPRDSALAIEIPHATKKRLGLDGERSWVVLTEANEFVWPGPDLRPARPAEPGGAVYGFLPGALFDQIRDRFVALLRTRKARTMPRTE